MSKTFDLMANPEGGGAADLPGRRSKGSSSISDRWSHNVDADSAAPPSPRSPRPSSGSSAGTIAQKFESPQAARPAPPRLGEIEATSSRKSHADLLAQFEGGGAQPQATSKTSPSGKRVVDRTKTTPKAVGAEAGSAPITDNPFMKRDSETRGAVSNPKGEPWKWMQAFKGIKLSCLQKRK